MELNLIMKDQIITIPSIHMVKKTFKIIPIPNVHMVKKTFKFTKTRKNRLTKKKGDTKYTEEKNALIKYLMLLHLQNKVIRFKLTNIL